MAYSKDSRFFEKNVHKMSFLLFLNSLSLMWKQGVIVFEKV